MEKTCPQCGETKSLEEFHKRSGQRAGQPQAHCKLCQAAELKQWRQRNWSPEKKQAIAEAIS